MSRARPRTVQPAATQRSAARSWSPRTAVASSSSSARVTSVSRERRGQAHRPRRDPAASRRAPLPGPRGRAGRAHRSSIRRRRRSDPLDHRERAGVEIRRAERARRLLGLGERLGDELRAPRGGGRRVVELVREARRQLAERGHLLHLQVADLERAGPIHHHVHQRGRQVGTLDRERRQVLQRRPQKISVVSSITELPGALASREYGSMPGHVARRASPSPCATCRPDRSCATTWPLRMT